jgi:hypothetical protein
MPFQPSGHQLGSTLIEKTVSCHGERRLRRPDETPQDDGSDVVGQARRALGLAAEGLGLIPPRRVASAQTVARAETAQNTAPRNSCWRSLPIRGS